MPLGEHFDIPYTFQVPDTNGAEMELVLTTKKGGVKRFEEVRRFKIMRSGSNGKLSSIVKIGSLLPATYPLQKVARD